VALGVYLGTQDRVAYLHRQAIEHYQQALAYESENYTDLALAEVQIALKFDPAYGPAQDKLRELQGANQAKPVPNAQTIAEQLFTTAQTAITQQQWSDAIDSLEELVRAKSDYRADEVKALLIQSYLNAGKQSVTEGQIEQARSRFDAALQLDPTNAEAKSWRARSVYYLNGVQAVGFDWQSAAFNFQQLYQLDPNFYDVKNQFLNALVNYGDLAVRQAANCIAAREYEQAVALGAGTSISERLAIANANCKQAVIAPTPTPTLVTESTPNPRSGASLFIANSRVDPNAICHGTGGISGTVRDVGGNALAGVSIQIYNDGDYRPPLFISQADGTYVIVLGKDAGLFHVVVLNADGAVASAVVNVNYPGGGNEGCHTILDWNKIQ
jgi:hypothetical protein